MSRNLYDSTNDTLNPLAGYQSIDSELSATSGNPLMNRVVKAALDKKFGYEDAAENSIATNDYIPFYDTSEGENKKIEVSKLNLGGGGSTITVTTTSAELFGQTVTLSKGTTTLSSAFDSQGEAVFAGVMMTGVLTVECEGNTATVDVTFFGNYDVVLLAGFDYEAWLEAGGVTGTYASLDDVLADEVALRRLFTVHASVDFMASVVSEDADVEKIINTDLAAKWINNRDYALDTLYTNEIIASYMDAADKYGYGEWVITDDTTTPPTWGAKGNVPVMTSNTAPYGVVSASSEYSSGWAAWRAFDGGGSSTNAWMSNGSTNQYIRYKSVNPICVRAVEIMDFDLSTGGHVKNFRVEGSNDGTNFTPIYTGLAENGGDNIQRFTFDNDTYYLYHQIYIIDEYSTSHNIRGKFQFYGRELSVSVPTMTSNTTPYGEASASSVGVSDWTVGAWGAFNPTENRKYVWHSAQGEVSEGQWLAYNFRRKVVVKKIMLQNRNVSEGIRPPHTFKIQGSNDGNEWSDVSEILTNESSAQNAITYYEIDNDVAYSHYRLYVLSGYDSSYVIIKNLQFYGLDYSEKEFEEGTTKKWLYDHGVELVNTDISGYTQDGITSILDAEREASQIYLPPTSSGSIKHLYAVPSSEIDLSEYNLVRISAGNKGTAMNSNYGQVAILPAKVIGTQTASLSITDMKQSNGLDISSVSSGNLIVHGGESTRSYSFKEFWLE